MSVPTRSLDVDRHFCLNRILDGTQDFRWRPREDGWFSGVLKGNLVHIHQCGGALKYRAKEDLDDLLRSYFRLDDDLDGVHQALKRIPGIAKLVEQYPYLRVLRQPDPWETTVAYICSPRSSIERICARLNEITKLGDCLELRGGHRHAFPTPEQVLSADKDWQGRLRGLSDLPKRIADAARRVHDRCLNLESLAQRDVPCQDATKHLMACAGIGPKIANCIALFALDKPHAYPLDRWIRKSTRRLLSDNDEALSDKELTQQAQELFGEHAGHAGQLLFRAEREKAGKALQLERLIAC